MFRSQQSISCVAAILAAVAIVPIMVMGETIVALQDDFSTYTSNEDVRAAWHNGALYRGNDPAYDSSPTPSYMSNNNQPGYQVCNPVLTTNHDWSVKFDLITKVPAWANRTQKAWLVNYDADAGTVKGYGINWELGTQNQYGSEGLVKIRRADTNTVAITNVTFTGTHLVAAWSNHYGTDGDDPGDGTGDDALDLPMAVFELKWTASTKTLSLYVDGSFRTNYVETTPITDSYNRLYLIGNSTGYFDDVLVTIIPPKGTLITVL